MTQEDLAEKVGVTRGAIAQWEGGGLIPKQERMKKLARALRTSHGKLFRMAGYALGRYSAGQVRIPVVLPEAILPDLSTQAVDDIILSRNLLPQAPNYVALLVDGEYLVFIPGIIPEAGEWAVVVRGQSLAAGRVASWGEEVVLQDGGGKSVKVAADRMVGKVVLRIAMPR